MEDKLIYDGWLKVCKRKVGNKEYDIVKNLSAVSAIVLNEYDEVLLVKQFRPSIMEETLEIPAGVLDVLGEEIEDCLIRELNEETALDVKREQVKKVISYKPILGFSSSTMHLFEVRVKRNDFNAENIDDADVTDAMWMPFKEFEQLISDGKIIDDKTIMAYFYIRNKISSK